MSKLFSIGKLAKAAGVSVRTIRFYINEGLLPPPQARGRNTLYSEEYLDRLELIRRLKEAFLPLREIRQQIEGLTIEEVRNLLSRNAYPDQALTPEIHLASSSTAIRPPSREEEKTGETNSATEYIARILHAHSPAKNPQQPVGVQIESLPTMPRFSTGEGERNTPATPLSTANLPQPALPVETDWRRFVLAAGVELHVSQPAMAEKSRLIYRLVELAHQLFETKAA